MIERGRFVHCLVQRPDAFPAIGTLSKGIWLAMIGVPPLVYAAHSTAFGILGLIAITIAAVYLLDVRPALRDAVEGDGSW